MRALDGVNFFVAAVQTGFGAFITVYLVKNQWVPQAIGFALTVGTLSAMLSQIPAGALIDDIPDKRKIVLIGIVGVGPTAMLMCASTQRSVESGRRPLLVAGWALLPFQGLAFARS